MRSLNPKYMSDLKSGLLSKITKTVLNDRDLIMELRDNYINIYFKGQNLVAITYTEDGYTCTSHEKFSGPASESTTRIASEDDVKSLLSEFPSRKDAISHNSKGAKEIEVEQLIIRANNYEKRLNTDYFILDRQLVEPGNRDGGRPDLTGFNWPTKNRRSGQEVAFSLFEVKYSLNPDINDLHQQIQGYYDWLKNNMECHVKQHQSILKQKHELGLFSCQEKGREDALPTLKISTDISKAEFNILLVDYNPASKILNLDALNQLSFRDQINIFNIGFGLWESLSTSLTPI